MYSDLKCFVADTWGSSEILRQAEGLRQGDPLACFLLLILMTVITLDAREAYFCQCAEQKFERASTYMEQYFGLQDVEFADDTNLIQTHLPSLRVLTRCYLQEVRYYAFSVNNDPREGKCYILAFRLDLPNVVVKDLDGRPFSGRARSKSTWPCVWSRKHCSPDTFS